MRVKQIVEGMKWRVIIGTWTWVICRYRDDCKTVQGTKWRGNYWHLDPSYSQLRFKEKEATFLCFFLFGTPFYREGKALLHRPQNLSFCFPFVCCWRPIIGVVWWGFFFLGSKSVRKLLSKWRIPRFSSQVLCRLRNKAAQEIGSCGRRRRRRRTWIWEWKRKRFFFGFFFFPPYVVRIILKNNKNKKDAQETSSENLFLEVKSCCSLRVRFGSLS